LSAADGGDLLRIIKDSGVEKWYLADQTEITTAKYFQIVSVYVALALLKSMEGTVIESGVKQALEILTGTLKPSAKIDLLQFNRKIRFTGFGRKSYSGQNEVLACLFRSN